MCPWTEGNMRKVDRRSDVVSGIRKYIMDTIDAWDFMTRTSRTFEWLLF